MNDLVFCLTLKQLGRTRLLHNSNRTHTGVVSEVSPGQIRGGLDPPEGRVRRRRNSGDVAAAGDNRCGRTVGAHLLRAHVLAAGELTFCNTNGQLY